MQFLALLGMIILVVAAALGVKACSDLPEKPAQVAQEQSKRLDVIALPDGATINAPPGSTSEQIASFLASRETAPRRFEPGGNEFNSWSGEPTPESQARLVAFTQLLKAYPNATVQIIGYTDNIGDAAANQKLSQDRADSVVRRLVESGISAGRLTAKGMGMAEPIGDNGTEAGRARNRRIAVIIDPDGNP
jgi:outer membrane protein OmpA-like peptidoglycan-associated protein